MEETHWGPVSRFLASSAFGDALYESPLLLIFVLPWTLTFLLALCYIDGALIGSISYADGVIPQLTTIVGFLLSVPWLLLIGKSMTSFSRALGKMLLRRHSWRSCLSEKKAELDAWIPKKKLDLFKTIAAIAVWSIASFPFTVLVTQMLEQHQAVASLSCS